VRRGHKVQVVATLLLQPEHLAGQFPRRPLGAVSHLADGIVLAVDAADIAIREKDRTRAFDARERGSPCAG